MKKTSLAAVLATIALCAGLASAATPIDKKFSTEPAISVALNPQAGITKLIESQSPIATASTTSDQADQQYLAVVQGPTSSACSESNQQNSSQPASGWTLAPAMMNGFSDGNSAPQMQTAKFDTGQADSSNVLSAKTAAMTTANASIGHDSAPVGSWATSTMTNEARAQHQQSATASYTLT